MSFVRSCCKYTDCQLWHSHSSAHTHRLPHTQSQQQPPCLAHIFHRSQAKTCLLEQGVEASKPAQPEEAAAEGTEAAEGEEDCSADFKPLVQLSEVESVSGEEAESQLCDL